MTRVRSALRALQAPDRAELFTVLLVLVAFNAISIRIATSLAAYSPAQAALGLFGGNAIIWFAIYAMLKLGLATGRAAGGGQVPITRGDKIAAAILLLSCVLPTHVPALLALVGGPLYLIATTGRGAPEWRVAIVALSLTGPLLWGVFAIKVFGPELLMLDASLGATFAGYSSSGNVITGPTQAHSVMVAAGCSAFRNITYVFVLAATLAQLFSVRLSPALVVAIVLAVIATMVVNAARIAALARFPEHFDYLHHGGGSTLFSQAKLLLMFVILGIAVMRGRPRAV